MYRAIAALCLLFLCAVQAIAAGNYRYHYFNEPLPLWEARGWIAVKNLSGSQDELGNLIAELFEIESQHATGLPGWSMWQLRDAPPVAEVIPLLTDLDGNRDYFFAPVFRGSGSRPGFNETIPGKSILVRWKKDHQPALVEEFLPAGCLGGNLMEPEPFGGLPGAFRVDPACHSGIDLLELSNRLAVLDEVLFAEPDMLVGGTQRVTPGDPLYDDSWWLNNEGQTGGQEDIDINAPEAWEITTGLPSVVTVVIDDGVSQDHPDIGQITPGRDFTGQSSDGGPVNRCDNHGTAVAGVVTSKIDDKGTVGTAPDALSRSARTFISEVPADSSSPCTSRWSTQFSWTVDALDWAQITGARITNNSNSYDNRSSSIASKYQQTHDAGMIHFASAGNDSSTNVSFPADLLSVNAVSAVNDTGGLASFSNFGDELSVAAPGVGINLTDRPGPDGYVSGDYTILDGTSFAAPMAAGVGALLLSRADNLTGREVELFIQASARDLGPAGFDASYGWGMVDAWSALQLLDIFSDDLESGDTSNWSRTVP